MFKRLLFRIRRKKEKPLKPSEKREELSDLKTICDEDSEAYQALRTTMLLKPWKIEISMEEAAESKNFWLAGSLAIYAGNVEKVKEYFRKDGRKWKILEPGITEKAVMKAQQYYAAQKKEKK